MSRALWFVFRLDHICLRSGIVGWNMQECVKDSFSLHGSLISDSNTPLCPIICRTHHRVMSFGRIALWSSLFYAGFSVVLMKAKPDDMEEVLKIAESYKQAGGGNDLQEMSHCILTIACKRRSICRPREAIIWWCVFSQRDGTGSLWPGFGCKTSCPWHVYDILYTTWCTLQAELEMESLVCNAWWWFLRCVLFDEFWEVCFDERSWQLISSDWCVDLE